MKTTPPLKAIFLTLFILLTVILFNASCKRNNPIEISLKGEAFSKNETEEIEAFFLISMANANSSIIAKSQIAQQKSSDTAIKDLSRRIENHENELQQEITKLAEKRLVVITEINATHKRDLFVLIDTNGENFKNAYLNSITESLTQQINLFETISKETNDKVILKLVLQFLPEQYKLLRETEEMSKTNY